MATKKEIATLIQLQRIVLEDREIIDEYDRPMLDMHPLQENRTYADGVGDALRILLKQKTLTEILNA